MAHLLRLIAHGVAWLFACWWLLQPLHSLAAFPPTSQTMHSCGGTLANPAGHGGWHSTPEAAIAAWIAAVNNPRYGLPRYVSGGRCWSQDTNTSTIFNTAHYTQVEVSCPANSTLSSGQCVCDSGFIQEGSTCVVDPIAAACEALSGQTAYLSFSGAVSPGGASCSSTGCAATVGSPVIRARTPGGTWVSEADAVFTGSTCTPSPTEPEAAPDTCPSGQQGEVNGVTVCIPYSSADEVERETGTTTETSDGTNTTSTTTNSTTTCTGNSCTTTTTTNVSVNGGTPTTTTTETTEPRDDFCTANPRAPQCRESSFGGSCDSGFTCQGDAVQCAQAQQLHRLACIVTQDSEEAALYGSEKNPAGGPADIPSDTVDVGPGSLEAGNALGVAACIPDLAITVAGTAVSLPLSNLCPYLAHLRLMLLAVAWLMAFRIVARD